MEPIGLKLAIAGATGLVGQELLRIYEAHGPDIRLLGLYASAASAGRVQRWLEQDWTVRDLAECEFADFDAAMFCIGDELSAKYVPVARRAGCIVVDKSNAFRLDPHVPLVVDGVNESTIDGNCDLAANPNCSTIILVHALNPLLKHCGIKRIWVATYQSVSGAGGPGVDKLAAEMAGAGAPSAMLGQPEYVAGSFAYNVVPGIGRFDELGRCSEEAKLVEETRKILGRPGLPVIAHAVRVPVVVGHSMAVTVELEHACNEDELLDAWRRSPYVKLTGEALPSPISSTTHEMVEVGRVRAEDQLEHGWSFFITGDNLRLGAALNGWRIMQRMIAAGCIRRLAGQPGGSNA